MRRSERIGESPARVNPGVLVSMVQVCDCAGADPAASIRSAGRDE